MTPSSCFAQKFGAHSLITVICVLFERFICCRYELPACRSSSQSYSPRSEVEERGNHEGLGLQGVLLLQILSFPVVHCET